MNKKFLSILYLLIILCLCSCSKDESERTEDISNLVALDVPILGISDIAEESTTTRSNPGQDTITVTQELEDGLVLESTLTCDTASHTTATRAATRATKLNGRVRIVMIAYRSNGSLYKSEIFIATNPKIHLPAGEKFKLVFYSYNNTTDPLLNTTGVASSYPYNNILAGYDLNDSEVSHTENAMWAKIDETPVISSSTTLPAITFTHLFSQVQWTINSVVGMVMNCSATMSPTFETAIVKVGNLKNCAVGNRGTDVWNGKGTSDYKSDFSFSNLLQSKVTSDVMVFCPDEHKESMVIDVNKIYIAGKTFTNKSIGFSKFLKRGYSYKITSTIKRKCTISFISENATLGTVSPSGPQSVEEWGQTLSSTPSAKDEYEFEGWYSSKDGYVNKLTTNGNYSIDGTNKLTVTVNDDTEGCIYAARYKPKSYTVTFTSNDESMGTVTNYGVQVKEYNTTITSTATATNANYILDGWYRTKNGVTTKVSSIASITVTFNQENDAAIYEAKFKNATQYKITFGTTGTGTGNITNGGPHTAASGQETSTATPNPNSTFDGWVDEVGNLISPSTVITESYGPTDKIRYAKFTLKTYAITFNAEEGGNVSPKGTFSESTGSKSSTATPNTGYAFDGWYKNGVKITQTNGDYYVSGNTVYANFNSNGSGTYTAKFIREPEKGLYDYVQPSDPLMRNAMTFDDLKRILATPNGVYRDDNGPAWHTSYTSGTRGLWLLKKQYAVAVGNANDVKNVGYATDDVRNSGRYFFLPAAGSWQCSGGIYPPIVHYVGATNNYGNQAYLLRVETQGKYPDEYLNEYIKKTANSSAYYRDGYVAGWDIANHADPHPKCCVVVFGGFNGNTLRVGSWEQWPEFRYVAGIYVPDL